LYESALLVEEKTMYTISKPN